MSAVSEPVPIRTAWQPLTPPGVAAFAGASLRRLALAQFVFAVLAAAVVVWFLQTAWLPTLREAIGQLPAQGAIRGGVLDWPGTSPHLLAAGRFLAFSVDVEHTGDLRSPAQIELEFGRATLRIYSLFGYTELGYPADGNFAFNQPELEPWWGAWTPPILWLAFGAVLAGLPAAWSVLATLYFLPAWLTAYFANRDLSLAGAWKLAGAAQLPGALLLTTAIFCYGFGGLDLVKLLAAFGAHWLCSWIFLAAAVVARPKLSSTAGVRENPFAHPAPVEPTPVEKTETNLSPD